VPENALVDGVLGVIYKLRSEFGPYSFDHVLPSRTCMAETRPVMPEDHNGALSGDETIYPKIGRQTMAGRQEDIALDASSRPDIVRHRYAFSSVASAFVPHRSQVKEPRQPPR
jgi:hypothetical protein